jgi:Tol biopolymer transport system component
MTKHGLWHLVLGVFVLIALATTSSVAGKGGGGKPPKDPPPTEPDPAIACSVDGELIVMNADGTNQTVLLDTGGANYESLGRPDWSPDGSKLAFWSDVHGVGVYSINVDGTGLTKLIATTSTLFKNVAWSPKPVPGVGKNVYRIAYADEDSEGMNDLFIINVDGSDRVRLTSTPDNYESMPTWSPSATRLALDAWAGPTVEWGLYDFGADTYAIQAHQGPLAGVLVSAPAWSKTQEDKIAWWANDDIWVVDEDVPASPLQLTATSGFEERWPSWSPDDAEIVFMGARIKGNRLRNHAIEITSAADGSNRHAVASLNAAPVWRR